MKTFDIFSLTHIAFTEEEKIALQKDMDRILEYCSALDKIDTSQIPADPLSNDAIDLDDLDADLPQKTLPLEKVFLNAPPIQGNYFVVPPVIED